ncbi:MAG: hypothetical protein IKN56_05175, partial [Clostridia bacterium]|nr:hypothetical protein [Clostridia bacterium]
REPQEVKAVIDAIKNALNDSRINCFDVVAYSSFEKKEYSENNSIERFLSQVKNSTEVKEKINSETADVVKQIINNLDEKSASKNTQRYELKSIILSTDDVSKLGGVAQLYGELTQEISNIGLAKYKVNNYMDSINKMFEEIGI